MDSNTLARLMTSDRMIERQFRGIYPLDMIPKNIPANSLIVVNQDRSMEAGSHWIVLHYKEKDIVEHFDSVPKSKLGFNVPFNSQGHIGTGPQHCHLWDSNPQR